MNIHQLRCFSAVAKTRSLSDGALRERVSEAALSRQIKNLERELGAQLFRVGRKLQLLRIRAKAFLPWLRLS